MGAPFDCAQDRRPLAWRWLGRVSHAAGTELQEQHRERVLAGDDDAEVLLLCEHDPVITLGRGADQTHVHASEAELARRGVALVRTTRGGDATYHGPGQLMVYPVVRVCSVVGYLEALAKGLADVAESLGVPGAAWRRDPAGLWLGDAKLAACGLHVRRGVAVHGWALNVSTPPDPWSLLVPCGLPGARVTSIADHVDAPAVDDVARLAAPILCRALDRDPQGQ
jgi:lipoate-protein ligase B